MGSNDALNQKAEGRVEDFRLGLECLCECEGRKDVMDLITESLPKRLYAKHKDRQTIQMIGITWANCHLLELTIKLTS